MKRLRTPRALDRALAPSRRRGLKIGFVPTMGALHEGHLALVRRARRDCDVVVASIFVNPLQFGPGEDYRAYPRTRRNDRRLLEDARVDVLYEPEVSRMYPAGFQTSIRVERLSKPLCGASRPIHFAGVATVVMKLLQQVRPGVLYLGRKDFQQCRVIERMIEDLSVPVRVVTVETVREPDGLAMSSRNAYLDRAQRASAAGLRAALEEVRRRVERGGERDARLLRRRLRSRLQALPRARVDYAHVVDARTLEDVVQLIPGKTALAAVAVCFGRARLIDNITLRVR